MTIQFQTISASKRTPGVDTEASLTGGSLSLSATRQRCMLVGQRMSAVISTPSFVSGTLNDCILGTNAAFTGTTIRKFIVQITTAAGTDVYKWSNDGGATWTTAVNCATSNTTLSEGVTVKFGAATGHALADSWTFVAFPAGNVAQKVPTSVFSADEAAAYFGAGSVLYRMVKAALATADNYGVIDLNCTAMNDAAGTAAIGAVEVTGTATAAGTLTIHIGNEIVQAGFSIGDTPAIIALALKAALDAQVEDLPVMCNRLAGTLGKIIFTSKNLGTCGNDVNLAAEYTQNTGIGATVTAMAGGATDPTNLADALDSYQGQRYHVIAESLADSTNLGVFTTHLDAVSAPGIENFAIGIFGTNTGTLATATTLGSGTNHMRAQCKYLRGSLSAGYEIAASYAALKTYVEDPSMPLNGMQLFGLHVPSVASRLSPAEEETCLWNGTSPLVVDEQGRVAVLRAITTDISHATMLDVTTITGWDYFRYAWRQRMLAVFIGAKNLAKTPAAVNTQSIFVAQQCEAAEMGVTNVAAYQDKFTAEQDANDPTRVNCSVPSPIIPGLQRICARFDLYY